ncbi:MAG: hypothetical protein ONB05_04825, partial [candidate division KSB1 bacterium]|nr:hypothetical protein [candidate division KSB1 bacterium]
MDTLPNIHSLIRQRLNALRQKDKIAAIFQGLLITVSASLVLGLIGVVTESLFRLETYGRSTLDLILLLIALGIVVWYVLRPFYSLFFKPDTPDDDSLALRVGEKYPHIKDKLVNALQVFRKHTHNPEGYSLELVDASLLEIAEEVKELDFHTVVDYRPLKKMGQWAGIIFAGCLIFWVAFWSPLSDASYRLLHPFTEFKVAPQFTLKVLPGNIEVLKGETVKIQALVEGKQPVDELILTLKRVDNGVEQHKILQPESPGRFQYLIENIKDSTEYFVRAQSVVSSKYLISVIELPMVRNLRLKLTYPAYSRLETRFLDENVGDVTALKGTQVQVTIKANKGLEKAELVFDGKTITEMKVSGLEAKGNFTLRKDGSYHIRLTDGQGNTNQDPIEYRLAVIEDQYPTVRIPVPGMDMDMGEDMRLFLVIEAEDDFGFSSARLGYRIIREGVHAEKDSHYINFQLPPAQNEKIGFNYDWDLSELNLMPEDVVNYFAEVFDNDLVSGPKNTRSLTYRVRFPSLQEIYAEVEKEHQETFQSLEGMYEQSKQLKEKLDQIVQEMKKDPNLNWEEKKQVEEALKTQQKMQQELEEVQKKLDEMIERMEKNALLSLETLQKYRELQQLFQEI